MSFPDRTLDRSTVTESLRAVAPEWELVDATPAESGHAAVYRCTVATADGERDVYLKATQDDAVVGTALEARLLAVLAEHTSLPVPEIIGAVDEADGLPTPLHVTAAAPGTTTPRTELGDLETATVERIARAFGGGLAELHALDVEGFGYLEAAGPTYRGERPAPDPDTVRVIEPRDDWRETVRAWSDRTFDQLAETRFADVIPDARPVVDALTAELTGEFEPALCHVDASIENVALDDGEPTAMLDWAFTVAATPAWDLVCIERALAGGHWAFVPETPDLREPVHEALFDAYRSNAPPGALAEYEAHGELYELLALLRLLHFHDHWFELKGVTDERADAAAAAERAALDDRL